MSGSRDSSANAFLPAALQPPLPAERFLVDGRTGGDAVPLDVLFIGGGPAGLAGAVELARLVGEDSANGGQLGAVEIGVLEKSETLGEHCLSGAVVNAGPLQALFPDVSIEDLPLRERVRRDRVYFLTSRRGYRIPTPPPMRNHGHYTASICEIVRWLGEKAQEGGVNVFTGFPADALLVEGGRVVGARTAPSGMDREGRPGPSYMPATDLTARVTVLAEGARGPLTQAWLKEQGVTSTNPQIFALGVKELWRVSHPLDTVIHTLGWPLNSDTFGGSWVYPMGEDLVSLGLVVGLDYPDAGTDVHELMQRLKTHPLVRSILRGGEIEEWGAKTIPEGGFYSLPGRLHGDGILIAGDAAGFVDVPSLKGIHYAMLSGMYAARVAFRALKAGDPSSAVLSSYDAMVRASPIVRDLHCRRNMRLAFKSGLYSGGIRAVLAILTGGRVPAGPIHVPQDAAEPRRSVSISRWAPDGRYTFSKADAVFRSGNATRDDIPSHLLTPHEVGGQAADFYARMCPAGVYEWKDDRFVVNAPNCIDCRATDVLGPRWTPREGGSGPRYKRM